MGGWTRDKKLAEIGRFVQLGFENDLEGTYPKRPLFTYIQMLRELLIQWLAGYATLVWNVILGWPAEEFQVFLANTRKELKDPKIHPYMRVKFMWAQKPVSS